MAALYTCSLLQIIVSFRGAEMPCPNDVLENSKLTPEFWHAQGTDGNMLVSSGAVDAMQAWMHALFGGVSGPAVHCGFMNSWKSVQVLMLHLAFPYTNDKFPSCPDHCTST